MKKAALGFIALAMALVANTVQASSGDIRSIDPCDQYGNTIPEGSISDPYTAGQTAYFRLRLENANSKDSWDYRNTTDISNPWQWAWDQNMYPGYTLTDMLAMYPPAIGVNVSGQSRAARIISLAVPAGAEWYTDIVCSYKVEPGDFALPMTLVTTSAGNSSKEYMLGVAAGNAINKSSLWSLVSYKRDHLKDNPDVIVATNACTLLWHDGNGTGGLLDAGSSQVDDWNNDLTLARAGLYIKTIDFAEPKYSVAQGRTDRVTVNVVGGANTNGNGIVYAKIKKGSAVSLAEQPLEEIEMWDGEANNIYQIAKITIPSGADAFSFSFKVKGERQDDEALVYLSSTKEFAYEDGFIGNGPAIVTNFVTATVQCVKPPPPYIAVTLDGESRKTVTAGPNYADNAATLTVSISEAHTSDVEIEVVPTVDDKTFAVGKKYVGVSTYSDNGYSSSNTTVKFTTEDMAAGRLSKNLYVYVLGGDDNTAAIDKGVLFTPVAKGAAQDHFNNENLTARLIINKSVPVILSPEEGWVHPEINGGVEFSFRVAISDDYMNLSDKYQVDWWIDGGGEAETISNLTVTAGEIKVPVTYIAEGSHTTSFRIKNSSGTYSDYRNFIVPVKEPKIVRAEIQESPDASGRYMEDVGELTVKFHLSEAYTKLKTPIYAYMVPMNEAASNQVLRTGLGFTEGVGVLPGQTTSFMDAPVRILDGKGSVLRFKIVLSASENDNSGNLTTISEYTSQDLYIPVMNKAPAVSSVGMSGSLPVTRSGDTFKNKAAVGLKKIFTLTADDVEADVVSNNVTVTWNFSDPNGYLFTTNMTGKLSDIALTNQFEVAGTYDCNVKIKDKDMSNSEFAKISPFDFKLVVSEKPTVLIKFPDSNTFDETAADKGLSYFDVELSTPASKAIEVSVKCECVTGASGVLNISTNTLSFRANQQSQRVLISELDGTIDSRSFKGGFVVSAEVSSKTLNDDGIPWKDVYDSVTEKIYVANEPPEIIAPVNTGSTNDAAINVQIPISWKIADVDFDLTNKLSVVWTTSEGVRQEFTGTNVYEGVFTNMFKSGGAKTVTITATDKDGGISSVTLYYKVAASKQVYMYPMGPSYGGLSALSRKYSTANGIGEGKIEADGTRATKNFIHTYTYGATEDTAEIYATGYANGESDSAINTSGNLRKDGEKEYTYSDRMNRDSFFYAWVISAKDEKATSYTGSAHISPITPHVNSKTAMHPLPLPMELAGDENNPMYPASFIEAFFSKEYYESDNMGDINADRVPDYYATRPWAMQTGEDMTVPQAMTGEAISGANGGEAAEGGSSTASDLANISTYNGDNDFFPAAWSSSNPLNPSERNWGPGRPFTVEREIRGIGTGLNEPGVSDYDLTPAEMAALYAACALAGEPAADYAAATNWAAANRWTPEAIDLRSGARLNPINPDTDGDGFDDGWEYFFWYYSKIGHVVDGVWSRLEGRRADFSSPKMGVRISAEEIAEAFDPHVVRQTESQFGMDFDNDGLSDLEEYALGTNPCDWDSDGDGAGDLWEVITGLNPCAADGDKNPDCDFMARCEYKEDTYTVYTFSDGNIFSLPSKTKSEVIMDEPDSISSYFKVETVEDDKTVAYWVEESDPVIVYEANGTTNLAKSVNAYASLKINKKVYLGEPVVLASGTAVTVSETAEPVPGAPVSFDGFDWISPFTHERGTTRLALKLFNYGGDGTTFVPCVSDINSYAEIPSNVLVSAIKTGVKLTLLHDQVNALKGFDPRTAWNANDKGQVSDRWKKPAGESVDTVAYTSRDEYLLMQYRMNAKKDHFDKNEELSPSVSFYEKHTTFPNLPLDFVRGQEYSHAPFTSTNETHLAYWDKLAKDSSVHGADTDADGIPDGWELYVNANPNAKDSISDGDKLGLADEYAGVDSCDAYAARLNNSGTLVYPEVESITKNHPGKNGGWWNKFFPTDPNSYDTDGDALSDNQERDSYKATFPVGRNTYMLVDFSFIYGDNAEKYSEDKSAKCFRGGGLNPCTVDTDGDLLPDAWEYEFAGVVLNNGRPAFPVETEDLLTMIQPDEHQVGLDTNLVFQIRGGMDGTYGKDANMDFDHDGLLNFQEYLVQTLRHLRYDDALTPLMGVDPDSKKFLRFIPFSAWDGNAFQAQCNKAGFTALGAWQFSSLGYFALPPHSWDPLALDDTGRSMCNNYAHSEGAGYRILLPPMTEVKVDPESDEMMTVLAGGYACTDPRRWDTDNDGMDDYYEIFHGLNPLLGSAADPDKNTEQGVLTAQRYDVISSIYGGLITSWRNHWADWETSKDQPAFDAIMHPWMIGTMECDADGDGLRNDEESLKVNLANPRNTHTDPTPLWMTDSTSVKFASFTSQYYGPDPYLTETPNYEEGFSYPDLFWYPWLDLKWNTIVYAPGSGGINRKWMFSFEENEGYDTDHDFKSDSTELKKGVEPTSDPLNFDDPVRRQALYLPGSESAAVSYDSESRRSIGTEPDLLKQFTVECWVRPEGAQRDAVIMERVSVYGASTLSNNQSYVRANFRIGVDAEGKVYGEYEGSTADSGSVKVTGLALKPDVWTHLAFTYNGYTAALYMNGEVAPVASANGVGLIPANGIDGILQESGSSVIPFTGYRALPCANIIGAHAVTTNAVSVNPETTWADFTSFFKGWVDEIRVWDGARTASDIHVNYLKRYSLEDVSALRMEVFKAWRNGATRADSNPKTALPVELLLHYNFETLPGAVEPQNVITLPTGFQRAVLDNVRKPNIKDLDEALKVGWWSQLAEINSKVYWNDAIVPWIPNTVAHLPLMDGSCVDSQYWSSFAAGLIGNQNGYAYPNSANPYPTYVYRFDKLNHYNRLEMAPSMYVLDSNGYSVGERYAFQLRSDFVGSTDLVPLGGAFAKRGIDLWDGQGAMDAWTATAVNGIGDSDEDGIPDWAEQLGFSTTAKYLQALAEGLLPDGAKNGAYSDKADANNDGLYDWWQRQHDLKGNAKSDTDKDGLADFAEYLVSDVFEFGSISPVLARTNGKEFDYFRKAGKLYLGELFSDHDFMEDEWENLFANSVASASQYDPSADADGDGWSNYAECRAGTLPDRIASVTVDAHQVPDYPEPLISMKAYYKNAAQVSAPIIVKAFNEMTGLEDAKWAIPGSDEVISCERVIGVNPGVKTKYLLGPSVVIPGTVTVYFRDPAEVHFEKGVGMLQSPAKSQWREVLEELPVPGNNDVADLAAVIEKMGSLVYRTGEVEIDFSAMPNYRYEISEKDKSEGIYTFYQPETNTYIRSDLAQSYVKIKWQSKRLVDESKWQFSLSRAAAGHVREGLNTFVAFVDFDGDGEYTDGEPMGVARNVNVGWNATDVEIELTDSVADSVRRTLGLGTDETGTARNTRVNVYRHKINSLESTTYGYVDKTLIASRDIGSRGYVHESDFMNSADFDIDWSLFKREVIGCSMLRGEDVTSVTYRVVIDSNIALPSNTYEVVRTFTTSQLKPVPVNAHVVNYGARPVFTWRLDGDGADTFTAFSIVVKDASGAEVWKSGYQAMPPRQVSGVYEWSAPLYVNDLASANKVFNNLENYTWQVSVHNSKYQDPSWSATQQFRMNVYDSSEANSGSYGVIKAAVKYFGPGAFNADKSKMTDKIRVEAFKTADFTGTPAGRCYIANAASVTNDSHAVNVTIAGLEAGTYYLRAFIDSDGDCRRSDWESWGYVCPRGDIITGGIFNPMPIEVGSGLAPVEVCYIEDTDVDQDCLPDVYEHNSAGTDKSDFLKKKGAAENVHNAYISVNPKLQTAIEKLIGAGNTVGLLSVGDGKVPMLLAALSVGRTTLENTIEESTLAVRSIALDGDDVTLTVGAEADEPSVGTVFVSDNTVTATIVVSYADRIDGEWASKELVKTFEIKDGTVSDKFTFSLEELGLDASKGFFKVKLK